MNLRKLFLLELFMGLVVSALAIIFIILSPEFTKTSASSLLVIALFNIYILTVNQLIKKQPPEGYALYTKAARASSIILGGVIFLAVMNLKNIPNGSITRFGLYIIVPIYLLSHSVCGLYLLARLKHRKDKYTTNEEPAPQGPQPIPFIVINNLLFTLTLLSGIAIFIITFYFLKWGSDPREAMVIPCCLVGYSAIVCVVNMILNKKRFLDEREKNIVFKITSLSTFFSIIVLLTLFALNSSYILGYSIKEIWGLIIVPLFMVFWGASGLAVLAKDDGWKWNLLSEE